MMMDAEDATAFRRLLQSHLATVEDWAWSDLDAAYETCESPIERKLLPHLVLLKPAMLGHRWGSTLDNAVEVLLKPQHEIGDYRVDFAMIVRPAFDPRPSLQVAIECDGHEFHDATKEAAARDKRRANDLQIAGWRLMRFSGRQIHENAAGCAEQVGFLINAHVNEQITHALGARLSSRPDYGDEA